MVLSSSSVTLSAASAVDNVSVISKAYSHKSERMLAACNMPSAHVQTYTILLGNNVHTFESSTSVNPY
jgi:hypothetical protein